MNSIVYYTILYYLTISILYADSRRSGYESDGHDKTRVMEVGTNPHCHNRYKNHHKLYKRYEWARYKCQWVHSNWQYKTEGDDRHVESINTVETSYSYPNSSIKEKFKISLIVMDDGMKDFQVGVVLKEFGTTSFRYNKTLAEIEKEKESLKLKFKKEAEEELKKDEEYKKASLLKKTLNRKKFKEEVEKLATSKMQNYEKNIKQKIESETRNLDSLGNKISTVKVKFDAERPKMISICKWGNDIVSDKKFLFCDGKSIAEKIKKSERIKIEIDFLFGKHTVPWTVTDLHYDSWTWLPSNE